MFTESLAWQHVLYRLLKAGRHYQLYNSDSRWPIPFSRATSLQSDIAVLEFSKGDLCAYGGSSIAQLLRTAGKGMSSTSEVSFREKYPV